MALKKIQRSPSKGERIVQEALPIHESKFRELREVTTRYGEKRTIWQDGYSGLGWRVAVLNKAGVSIEEVENIPRRERRNVPNITQGILKAQKTTFGAMLKTTEKFQNEYGVSEDKIDGDFLTSSTPNVQEINHLLWHGPRKIYDYVLLYHYMRRISRQERIGDFDVKIDPERELEEGKIHLKCVGAGTEYEDEQVDPWLPVTMSVTPLLAVHGLSLVNGRSQDDARNYAINRAEKIAALVATDPASAESLRPQSMIGSYYPSL